jgi:hypothetical protein
MAHRCSIGRFWAHQPPWTSGAADAAFAVRAVNSHDALVKALEAANDWLQRLEDGVEGDTLKAIHERAHAPIRKTINAALALAEGKEPHER